MRIKKLLGLNQAGFSHVEAGVGLLVIAVVAVVGVYVGKHSPSHAASLQTSQTLTCTSNANKTCLAENAQPIDGTGMNATVWACLQTINLAKEGEPNQYNVIGYAETSTSAGPSITGQIEDFTAIPGDRQSTSPVRWAPPVPGNNKWLDGVVTDISHSVNISQTNLIAMRVVYADNGSGTWVGFVHALSLAPCT